MGPPPPGPAIDADALARPQGPIGTGIPASARNEFDHHQDTSAEHGGGDGGSHLQAQGDRDRLDEARNTYEKTKHGDVSTKMPAVLFHIPELGVCCRLFEKDDIVTLNSFIDLHYFQNARGPRQARIRLSDKGQNQIADVGGWKQCWQMIQQNVQAWGGNFGIKKPEINPAMPKVTEDAICYYFLWWQRLLDAQRRWLTKEDEMEKFALAANSTMESEGLASDHNQRTRHADEGEVKLAPIHFRPKKRLKTTRTFRKWL